MKQLKGSFDCIPVVAAMIVGCKPDDFINFIYKTKGRTGEKGYTDLDFIKFMTYMGWTVGVGFSTVFQKKRLNKNDYLTISIPIEGNKSIMFVESEIYKGEGHAIYWDGNKVHDPNPKVRDGRPLRSYVIRQFFPVYDSEGQHSDMARSLIARSE